MKESHSFSSDPQRERVADHLKYTILLQILIQEPIQEQEEKSHW